MSALQIGPLVLPGMLLAVFASLALALAVGGRLGARAGVDARDDLWLALGAALAVARGAFVAEYPALYFAEPLTLLDIRDGGWNAQAGVVGAWLFAWTRWRRRPPLRRPLVAGLAVGTSVFLAASVFDAVQSRGAPLPDVPLATLDGRAASLGSFAGQPLVVNLWATWCAPCVREMPVFAQAQQQRPDVRFVFVNQGEDGVQVRRWLDQQGVPLQHVLLDPPRRASAVFQQQGYPTTLFFDAQGRLVTRHLGALSAATLADRLERIAPR